VRVVPVAASQRAAFSGSASLGKRHDRQARSASQFAYAMATLPVYHHHGMIKSLVQLRPPTDLPVFSILAGRRRSPRGAQEAGILGDRRRILRDMKCGEHHPVLWFLIVIRAGVSGGIAAPELRS
jgi:hypothetical protein